MRSTMNVRGKKNIIYPYFKNTQEFSIQQCSSNSTVVNALGQMASKNEYAKKDALHPHFNSGKIYNFQKWQKIQLDSLTYPSFSRTLSARKSSNIQNKKKALIFIMLCR